MLNFKKRRFEEINKKNHIYVITDAAVLLCCLAVFFMMYFNIFDKEFSPEIIKQGIYTGLGTAFIILLLRRRPLFVIAPFAACFCAVIYMNYDVLRESLIQIVDFARTHASFTLDRDIYSGFLSVSFFLFICLMAFLQNLRISFIPYFLFMAAATAYITVMNKPYDPGLYILGLVVGLCLAAYSFSSRNSPFLGFVSFGIFGLCALFVTSKLATDFNEQEYKAFRTQSELLSGYDKTSFIKKLKPDLMISSLTEGNLYAFTMSGLVRSQLMLILTLSDYTADFCMKSYTGDSFSGSGWVPLPDSRKAQCPVENGENISMEIVDLDHSSGNMLFGYNTVEYSIERTEAVKNSFQPYFMISGDYNGGSFYELKTEGFTYYDLTPERIRQILTAEAPGEKTENVLGREEKYSEYVKDNYLDVPDELKDTLGELTADLGQYQIRSQLLSELRSRINEKIAFTITPPAPEAGADPIKFTIESGKGGSNQIASVGVMALRYMGLPARYAEGIAIKVSDKDDSSKVSDKYKTDITNMDAIAYAEVYIDGFGWLPVNFLPDNAEETIDAEINSLKVMDSAEFSAKLKHKSAQLAKGALRTVSKTAAAVVFILFILSLLRRYLIILIRQIKLSSKNIETKKNALYGYTEAVKAFFGENIFENTPIYGDMNLFFYSSDPKDSSALIYKETKAAAKNRLKKSGLKKRLSAFFIKII